MPASFDHFLITRFNLYSSEPNWHADKHAQATLTANWLEHRINIFIKYCLPSVVNQVNQNFKWLLLFSTQTPVYYLSLLQREIQQYNNYEILLIKEEVNFTPEVANYILINKSEAGYCMTTRLDNDDLLHKDTINDIQKKFQKKSGYCINPMQGLMLKIEGKSILTKVSSPASPFITYVESYDDRPLQTVFSRSHSSFNYSTSIIQINRPLWLQLVHKRNLLNELKGRPVFKINNHLKDYGIEESEIRISFTMTVLYIFRKVIYTLHNRIKRNFHSL